MNPESREKYFSSSLREVEPIEVSRNQMVIKRDQLEKIVERPLLKASIELYDKNIRTLASSANKKGIEQGFVYLIIDFDSLSKENQEIAKQLSKPIDYDEGKAIKIEIPVTEGTTLEEIEQKAKEVTSRYQKQPMTWAPTFTLEQLKKAYGIEVEEKNFDDPKVWEEEGYFYDKQNRIFYMSGEHYKKVTEKFDQ